jgi:hypothetical protein
MNFEIKANRTHYIKYHLLIDEQLSLRYHFLWQDCPTLENKFILKHHNERKRTEISEDFAKMLIKNYCTKKEEIVASVDTVDNQKIHKKIVINSEAILQVEGNKEDTVLKTTKINKEWRL